MDEDPPEELKPFQRRTLVGMVAIVAFGAAMWGVGFYRQERWGAEDSWQIAIEFAFGGSVLALMIFLIYRATMAKPRCPRCSRRMEACGKITLGNATWKVVECRNCGDRYRVWGAVFGGRSDESSAKD